MTLCSTALRHTNAVKKGCPIRQTTLHHVCYNEILSHIRPINCIDDPVQFRAIVWKDIPLSRVP